MTTGTRYVALTHGPYSLLMLPALGPMAACSAIVRRDPDHTRTVASIDTISEWERFVAALESGANEVAAVHAIDA